MNTADKYLQRNWIAENNGGIKGNERQLIKLGGLNDDYIAEAFYKDASKLILAAPKMYKALHTLLEHVRATDTDYQYKGNTIIPKEDVMLYIESILEEARP